MFLNFEVLYVFLSIIIFHYSVMCISNIIKNLFYDSIDVCYRDLICGNQTWEVLSAKFKMAWHYI